MKPHRFLSINIYAPAASAADPLWEEDEDVLVIDDIGSDIPAQIIVYNDDHNTFEWVIQCFMEVLKHPSEQAEQLSLIIHFKGKATVKSGPKSELLPLREQLVDRGLSAVIEDGT
ncbi:MAG: ATP-dependent Clp protease adaptor ClpS [Saprospiraceae bacterium]|nr:ATP-dependent Clp protease adaptor ClpS [Saprospiraceae bacterium]